VTDGGTAANTTDAVRFTNNQTIVGSEVLKFEFLEAIELDKLEVLTASFGAFFQPH